MRASLRRRVAVIIGAATLAASVAVVAAPSVALAADVIINVPTTFAAADASDGASDGTFTVTGNLTITSAGAVTCNDPASPPNADACDIDIAVSGDMVMQAGSAILAENNVRGGSGGDITIDVDGDMTNVREALVAGVLAAKDEAQRDGGDGIQVGFNVVPSFDENSTM